MDFAVLDTDRIHLFSLKTLEIIMHSGSWENIEKSIVPSMMIFKVKQKENLGFWALPSLNLFNLPFCYLRKSLFGGAPGRHSQLSVWLLILTPDHGLWAVRWSPTWALHSVGSLLEILSLGPCPLPCSPALSLPKINKSFTKHPYSSYRDGCSSPSGSSRRTESYR